ncbi:class I SAM-dependent rRNA methyltransferase [Caldithrix abyssi]
MKTVILKKGREKSLLRKHPWIFSGAVKSVEGQPQSGETVAVQDWQGRFLGRGAYSPRSQIVVRMWSFEQDEAIDNAFFEKRLLQALRLRSTSGIDRESTAVRLIASDADGLPGIIVDRYNQFLVCQFLSAGAEYWKKTIVHLLQKLLEPQGIYERSDVDVRKKEGLTPTRGLLAGQEPPALLEINEQEIRFLVDVKRGHKTGFYLDQRVNRRMVRQWSAGRETLNCFAYTGGFGLAALKGGAKHVTNLEDVAGLLELQEKNFKLNQFKSERYENVKADVFRQLRRYHTEGRRFDLIILDPPKFVDSQHHLMRASRGYKDINRLAFELLRPEGVLFTFSCSGLMKMDLFQKIVADAALEANREAQILQWLFQAPDHPIKLHIPESLYLKGLLCRV